MCHQSCLAFGLKCLEGTKGKTILEVGSQNINGSLRDTLGKDNKYYGVDIQDKDGVDEVCNATEIQERFGDNSFDIVICTEVLEHVEFWKDVINNLKAVAKDTLLITTRGIDYPRHEYPNDYWRYTVDDFAYIFSDMDIEVLEPDPQVSGVFLYAHKTEKDQTDISNYSIQKAPC